MSEKEVRVMRREDALKMLGDMRRHEDLLVRRRSLTLKQMEALRAVRAASERVRGDAERLLGKPVDVSGAHVVALRGRGVIGVASGGRAWTVWVSPHGHDVLARADRRTTPPRP